jgi:chemosensory pili system protein ChpC
MAERVAEIYSLLVPLVDGRLIIPRACVAEVIGFQTPSEMTGAPPWYIGTVPWNGKAVPLVSFELGCRQTRQLARLPRACADHLPDPHGE